MSKFQLHQRDSAIIIREGGVFELRLPGDETLSFKAADVQGDTMDEDASKIIAYALCKSWECDEIRDLILQYAFKNISLRKAW